MKNNIQKTKHRLINGDARELSFLDNESIHLVVTSPPYWNLKRYNENPDQLGHVNDYESFLSELEKVWLEVFRVLVPGGATGMRCRRRMRFKAEIWTSSCFSFARRHLCFMPKNRF